MDRIALRDRMHRTVLLRRLSPADLDRLASRSELRELAPGEVLLREGERGQTVYLIVSGALAIEKRVSAQESVVLAVRGESEWVGEMALIDEQGGWASAVARTGASVLEVPRPAFLEAIASSPEAALDLVRTLTDRLRESDRSSIELLAQKNAELDRENRLLSGENRRLRGELDERAGFAGFVGASPASRRVRQQARQAAESDLPVLLLGETGTGKEVLARAIHANGARARAPFVPVNCALFQESLLESALFGHVRGAFTGASSNKAGLVETAEGGTLFLDEIAEMPRSLQAALLRFLELGEYRRVGETRTRHADARVVAATHCDLEDAVAHGEFRRDLFFRLDVFRIEVPPLRARRSDIPLIAEALCARIAARRGVPALVLLPETLELLASCPLVGNVRELENELERQFAIREPGATLRPEHVSERIRGRPLEGDGGYSDVVRAFKASLVQRALDESNGNQTEAAQRLGVHRSNLSRMIRDLGLQPPRRGVGPP